MHLALRLAALALLVTLLAALAATPAGAARSRSLAVGLAEQKSSVFGDGFFQRLHVRHARLHVGWDVLHNDWERERTDRWLEGAASLGIEPLITFGQSRIDHTKVPTPARFARELKAFRERWPEVRRFAAWNEVNHRGEATLRDPGLAVRWWKALRRACPRCTILPAELLDTPNMITWVRAFQRRAGRSEPAIWGLHSYSEVNRLQTRRVRQLLRAVRGRIWITEAGGVVRRLDRTRPSEFPENEQHAARVVRFLFRRVAALSPRIERVYVYNWNADSARDTWDSALVDELGWPRPAWYALLEEISALR